MYNPAIQPFANNNDSYLMTLIHGTAYPFTVHVQPAPFGSANSIYLIFEVELPYK